MVRIRELDRPGWPWIAEVASDRDDEERILIGRNGKLVLERAGWLVELWPGFASEADFEYDEYLDEGRETELEEV